MFKVNGSIGVMVAFGGAEYPLSKDSFESICIVENACQILPTCRLILNDVSQFFNATPIQEGSMFTIIITNDFNKIEENVCYLFAVSGEPEKLDNNSYSTYVVQGIAPYFHLLRDRILFSQKGNSNEIVKSVVDKYNKIYTDVLKIETDCDDFEDSMTWYSGNRSAGQFLQYVSDFGYKDENSCACLCTMFKNPNSSKSGYTKSTNSNNNFNSVSENYTSKSGYTTKSNSANPLYQNVNSSANYAKLLIRYKNICDSNNEVKAFFSLDATQSSTTRNIMYNSISSYTNSSLFNMLYGNRYLHTDHLFDCKCEENSKNAGQPVISSNGSYTKSASNNNEKIYKNIKMPTSFSNYLNMDSALLSDEDSREYNVRMEYSPLDCGNNHSHFWRAYFQNKRFRCAFSTNKSIITLEETGLNLLDTVQIKEFLDSSATENTAVESKKFIVSAKTRCINDNYVYCERILLSTTGPDIDSIGNLTTQTSSTGN